jgi:hypothetical protein
MADRDYKKEYEKYHGTEKYKKDRASRNKVRRKALRDGRIKKGSSMDIDHKNGNPRDNRSSNLRIVHRSVNRAKH